MFYTTSDQNILSSSEPVIRQMMAQQNGDEGLLFDLKGFESQGRDVSIRETG